MSARIMRRVRQLSKVLHAALRSRTMAAFYDDISTVYDDVFISHEVHGHNIARVLTSPFTGRERETHVLDLGCGTGMLSVILAANGFNLIGLDISFASLCRMKLKIQGAYILQGDANALPFDNHSLDAVVSLGSWRHLRDIGRVTSEIARVLKPEGVFIVGYFPPDLGGLMPASRHWWSQWLCRLYGTVTRKLGYWDRADCLLEKDTEKVLTTQFDEVLTIASGAEKQLFFARYPIHRARDSATRQADQQATANGSIHAGDPVRPTT